MQEAIRWALASPPPLIYPALYLIGKINDVLVFFVPMTRGDLVRINDDQHQYGWIGQAVTGDPRIYGRVYLATNGRGILYADPVQTSRK